MGASLFSVCSMWQSYLQIKESNFIIFNTYHHVQCPTSQNIHKGKALHRGKNIWHMYKKKNIWALPIKYTLEKTSLLHRPLPKFRHSQYELKQALPCHHQQGSYILYAIWLSINTGASNFLLYTRYTLSAVLVPRASIPSQIMNYKCSPVRFTTDTTNDIL